MGDFTAAVRVELLKLRRSRAPMMSALTFSLVGLVDGLFMVILKDPAAARRWGLLGAKAQLAAGVADAHTALGFLAQATGIGGLFVFGLVFVWVFGREFADRTVKDLLALPVPRTTIVAAKFTVAAAWCLVLAAWTAALGVGVVTTLRLPGADAGTVTSGLARLLLTAVMTIVLVAPFALLASVARGYLAPVGGILLATFLGQIVAALGYGAYFPWAVPALYAGIEGVHTRPGPIGYALVALVGVAAALATGSWWRRADQAR
jgi:ABC-2 type transport system permease protein